MLISRIALFLSVAILCLSARCGGESENSDASKAEDAMETTKEIDVDSKDDAGVGSDQDIYAPEDMGNAPEEIPADDMPMDDMPMDDMPMDDMPDDMPMDDMPMDDMPMDDMPMDDTPDKVGKSEG